MRKLAKVTVLAALVLGLGALAVWLVSSGGEAEAATTEICHYDGGKVTQNKVHQQHSWSVVEVNSDNAVAKHLANHQEPSGPSDIVIGAFTEQDCDDRDTALAPLVADGPPGQQP